MVRQHCGCEWDELMEMIGRYCPEHLDSEGYRDFAFRTVSHVSFDYSLPFSKAFPKAIDVAETYARQYAIDVAKLREAIRAEAATRGIAA